MLYSCTHMATADIKGLRLQTRFLVAVWQTFWNARRRCSWRLTIVYHVSSTRWKVIQSPTADAAITVAHALTIHVLRFDRHPASATIQSVQNAATLLVTGTRRR